MGSGKYYQYVGAIPLFLVALTGCRQKSMLSSSLSNSYNQSSSSTGSPGGVTPVGAPAPPSNIVPPAQAAAWGFTKLALNQGGSAGWNIDMNNTGKAGYTWYSGGFYGTGTPITGNFSVGSEGVLTVTGADSGFTGNWNLATAKGVSGTSSYVGSVYSGGFYTEASISVNGAAINGKLGWPAFWGQPVEHVIGDGSVDDLWPGQASGYTNWVELDFMEQWSTFYTFGNINWYGINKVTCTTSGGWCRKANDNGSDGLPTNNVAKVPSGTNWKNFNTYGAIVVTSNLNHGNGFTQGYFNNATSTNKNTWTTYNPSIAPAPTGGQIFAVTDVDHFIMILGTGSESPMKVNWVRVWQKP
jgi:hypothetical protein